MKLKRVFIAIAFVQIPKCVCQYAKLSQTEGRTDRGTFQTTWHSLAKWLPTARFISGSSVLFTLFNCLTVPVYAVSLPILSASIKGPSFPSTNEQHLKFASGRTAGCDQTKCSRPASCRHRSHILQLRRGQSTLKALFVLRVCICAYVCACIFMCVSVCDSQFPCSWMLFARHLKVGGLIENELSL